MESKLLLENVLDGLLKSTDVVFIVCHPRPDFDAIGASIGCALIAKKYKRPVYIVIDDDIKTLDGSLGTKAIIDDITDEKRINDGNYINVINSSNISSLITGQNLLLVLDMNDSPRLSVNPCLNVFDNIVVIDHHELSPFQIDAKYKYINPYKSSTCEIVTDLMQKLNVKITDGRYADYLLAGIRLDTDGYRQKMSDVTFKIASRLVCMGADNCRVGKMFIERDFERETARKTLIANNTEKLIFEYNVALTADNSEDIYFLPEDLAKVAKSLQELGFNVSFAIGKISETIVAVSARSDGSINVGKIMNSLGGGGSETSAAARIPNMSVAEVKVMLKKILTPCFFVEEPNVPLMRSKKLELTIE